jgi:hypothetical protein
MVEDGRPQRQQGSARIHTEFLDEGLAGPPQLLGAGAP